MGTSNQKNNGIDVLSSLEYQFLNYQQACEYKTHINHFLGEMQYYEFCAQEFKPEMIMKYFKGFECNSDDPKDAELFWQHQNFEPIGKFRSYKFYIDFSITFQILRIFEYNDKELEECCCELEKSPRTLDDFINDTTRAGIILEWKGKECEQIRNK